MQIIANDTQENDDWMKTLPGYETELSLFDDLNLQTPEPITKMKVTLHVN